ncbi:hypothetical protein [Actinophytocola oryzae]|uniref:Uncharacterized protein n=1 Tax=Actinophytocola oryzae TaxID=502181 RepID=A0A4V3FQS4_9PSEU|nr:hypothetical protein [Actinophytocola oryzae]TDV40791.1 hypothetical protein CLV71_122184 [Actinophytocola oryzae]
MDAREGSRRADRREAAAPCPACGELLGRGYPSCAACAEAVDRPLRADWDSLSSRDPEVVADAAPGEHPWTCVDWALRQLRCEGCGGELAAGAAGCVGCAAADSARWETPAPNPHEHALRTASAVLRAPTWRREAVVSTWRLVLPFVLTGAPVSPDDLRTVRTFVLAGRYDELAALETLPLVVPLLPWRRTH